MYYSVCASSVFSGVSLPEALRSIRQAGYDHYEFWGWWDQDIDALYRAQCRQQLTLAAMCTRFISLTDPIQRESYIAGLGESIEVSKRLGCTSLISQVGQEMPGVSRRDQYRSIVDGLRACVPMLKASGRALLIEPLNTKIDHPSYFLWRSKEAFQIVEEVDDACVQVLYDVYHQHIMGENTILEIEKNIEKMGHIHIAGYPGRHELLNGNEIDLGAVLKALVQSGYTKGIGLEYFPTNEPVTGLQALMDKYPLR